MGPGIKKTRILLFTGKKAEADLTALDWKSLGKRFLFTFHTIPAGIIAFLSKEQLEQSLSGFRPDDFDFVLVSGLIPWDVSTVGGKWSAKIKKGPKFLVRIPEILKNMDLESLSSIEPADTLFRVSSASKYQLLLNQNRQKVHDPTYSKGFQLSESFPEIWFSPDLPPILLAEIVDFPRMELHELEMKIEYYLKSGADIIDLGCIANEDNSAIISNLLPKLREKFNVPFSIDSINPKEIHAAAKVGIEMVLSVNFDNYSELLDLPKQICLVIIPISFKDGFHPHEPAERIKALMKLGKLMNEQGFTKLFLDPITDSPISPGIIPTLETLSDLQRGLQQLPAFDEENHPLIRPQLFMGFGNLTELIDADSPGINSLLTLIAAELDVTAILSTEYSNKARKSLEEIAISRQMTYLAKQLHVPPINLGITALRLKSKHRYPEYLANNEPKIDVATAEIPAEMDPKGYFKIAIDFYQNHILISHYSNNGTEMKQTITITGTSSEAIYKEIITRELVSRLDHAAYLGKELQRAEIALKFGTEYIQE